MNKNIEKEMLLNISALVRSKLALFYRHLGVETFVGPSMLGDPFLGCYLNAITTNKQTATRISSM